MTGTAVMLVDDEVPFVDAMTRRLTRRSLAVVAAFSGAEALEALGAGADVDVVVLDVKMPGMDGIDTLREIRKRYPLLEVIMLTGHATVESAIEGMRLGAFDYLMKPCDIEQLIEKIHEARAKRVRNEGKMARARMRETAVGG